MRLRVSLLCFAFALVISNPALSQRLDPGPYVPGVDPDIDMYMGSWKTSLPLSTHGSLVERSVLTKGDPQKPVVKGAVLKFLNRFSHASLAAYNTTTETTLKGEQEIIYILSGKGTLTSGAKTYELFHDICLLIPPGLPFTIKNTGATGMEMFLASEPVPQGFRTNREILVRDENTIPILSTNGHWCHIVKRLFATEDGLGTMESVITVTVDPMTIPHPHSHVEGCEEIWTQMKGTSLCFIGKHIRWQEPGTGYLVPPNGNTPHSNINVSDEPVKFLYLSRFKDHELRK